MGQITHSRLRSFLGETILSELTPPFHLLGLSLSFLNLLVLPGTTQGFSLIISHSLIKWSFLFFNNTSQSIGLWAEGLYLLGNRPMIAYFMR